jgi:hypothetical protein
MELCITFCQDHNVGVPKDFIDFKRAVEEKEGSKKSPLFETNEDKARRLERAAGLK